MSRYENILVDVDRPLAEVAKVLGDAVGRPAMQERDINADPYWTVALDGGSAWLDHADLVDEPGRPFSRYRYLIEVQGRDRDAGRQEHLAQDLFDRLAAATPWHLLLAFDDGQRVIATRDTRAAA